MKSPSVQQGRFSRQRAWYKAGYRGPCGEPLENRSLLAADLAVGELFSVDRTTLYGEIAHFADPTVVVPSASAKGLSSQSSGTFVPHDGLIPSEWILLGQGYSAPMPSVLFGSAFTVSTYEFSRGGALVGLEAVRQTINQLSTSAILESTQQSEIKSALTSQSVSSLTNEAAAKAANASTVDLAVRAAIDLQSTAKSATDSRDSSPVNADEIPIALVELSFDNQSILSSERVGLELSRVATNPLRDVNRSVVEARDPSTVSASANSSAADFPSAVSSASDLCMAAGDWSTPSLFDQFLYLPAQAMPVFPSPLIMASNSDADSHDAAAPAATDLDHTYLALAVALVAYWQWKKREDIGTCDPLALQSRTLPCVY